VSGLYTPSDLYAANDVWGASCGPGALAAVLGLQVLGLQPLFPKPWTTPTTMGAALRALGKSWREQTSIPLSAAQGAGLAFLQIQGKWDNAPERVRYRHTHWVGFAKDEDGLLHVYDVNAPPEGGWQPLSPWERGTMQAICARHPQASGRWHVRVLWGVVT
jgi:hypothetical protein